MDLDKLCELLGQARIGVVSGGTVITAGSREGLLEKVAEAMDAAEKEQEEDYFTSLAESIDAEKAAVFAGAALMAAAREFEQGHYQHAQIKVDAADTWTSLGELMFRLEQRRELREEDEREEAALNAMFAKEERQAAEDAAKLREEASSGTPAE